MRPFKSIVFGTAGALLLGSSGQALDGAEKEIQVAKAVKSAKANEAIRASKAESEATGETMIKVAVKMA